MLLGGADDDCAFCLPWMLPLTPTERRGSHTSILYNPGERRFATSVTSHLQRQTDARAHVRNNCQCLCDCIPKFAQVDSSQHTSRYLDSVHFQRAFILLGPVPNQSSLPQLYDSFFVFIPRASSLLPVLIYYAHSCNFFMRRLFFRAFTQLELYN